MKVTYSHLFILSELKDILQKLAMAISSARLLSPIGEVKGAALAGEAAVALGRQFFVSRRCAGYVVNIKAILRAGGDSSDALQLS